jgi:hypothetical protein
MANTKEHAHELIYRMAPGQVAVVVGLLEIILDPVARSLGGRPGLSFFRFETHNNGMISLA